MKKSRNKVLFFVVFGCLLLYYNQQEMKIKDIKRLLENVNWKHKYEVFNETIARRYEAFNETMTQGDVTFSETIIPIYATSNKTIIPKEELTFITVLCCHNPDKSGINENKVQSKYLKQLIALLKSAVITTRKPIRFHVVTNMKLTQLEDSITHIIGSWPEEFRSKLLLSYNKIYYPPGTEFFQKMGNPCVTQRLFFADMFTETDAAVYMDLDIIFLKSPEDLWAEFGKFDAFQLAAVGDATYYRGRNKKIPYYSGGINPGVTMMNMTRMRQLMVSSPVKNIWSAAMIHIANSYKGRVRHDMDILNVFFKMNPRLVYLLPCWWSFIKTFCKMSYPCMKPMADENRGVALIHGAGGQFSTERSQRQFKAVWDAFNTYNFETPIKLWFSELKKNVFESKKEISSHCNDNQDMPHIMTIELERTIYNIT